MIAPTGSLRDDPAPSGPLEQRVLILATTGNDALLTTRFLADACIRAETTHGMAELCAGIREGCGTLLIAEETLSAAAVEPLLKTISEQPSWSDIPLVLITSGGETSQTRLRRLTTLGPAGNVTMLERPFRPVTLLSAVETALRARCKQYQVRDLLKELLSARDAALEAARAKDNFLAALSHELRTPLNPVLLIASEAANDPELPERVREDFETIARNATLEARLIDDLLDLTRITHGKMSLDKRVIDLHAVLADAMETVSSELREKRQILDVKLADTDCLILGDPARIQQVLWNVLKNAVKFTPHGGTICVETLRDEDRARSIICIRDSGIGMTDDEVGRVFDAFSQGNHAQGSSSHRFGGLGLGLAISHKLVEMHGGKISASSKGRDQGATFTIEFPLVPAEEGLSIHEAVSENSLVDAGESLSLEKKYQRILVIEDHVATRLSLIKLLARRGYEVTSASTVAEALQRAAEADFDLVISDIGLPDGDGYTLMRSLRANYGVAGIALSGYGMEHDIARGRAAGFTEHLTKPVSIKSLDRVLRTLESPRQTPPRPTHVLG